ncbi:hypothetical protein CMK10_04545 [Candidatus Poribacteria bacterium]|nr:hypothetical protein [Candidatus Poribacteria bacterium]
MLGRTELPLDKLALYMSFDNVSGDTVKDESKNGNNGKIVKASTAKGKDKYGDAMEFNGKDSHVLIKSSDSLSISGEVTISVWVNWKDAGDGWLCVLANGKQSGPWKNYGLFVNRGNKYFYFTTSLEKEGAHKVRNFGNNTTQPGKWTHCICTYDGKTAKIYVDGELKKEDTQGLKLVGGKQDLRIGHRLGSGHWYNRLIDEVALTAAQAKEAAKKMPATTSVQSQGKLASAWGSLKAL